jgi:hypothetical protein
MTRRPAYRAGRSGRRLLGPAAVQEAGRDSLGQLVGPGIAAEVELGVAEAGVRIVGQQIDAGKTALRELIPAGEGHAVLSGAKLVEVDHLALAYPGWWKVRPGGGREPCRYGAFSSKLSGGPQKLSRNPPKTAIPQPGVISEMHSDHQPMENTRYFPELSMTILYQSRLGHGWQSWLWMALNPGGIYSLNPSDVPRIFLIYWYT